LKAALALLPLMLVPIAAWAQSRDASYFCSAEVAGGLAFDTVNNRWIGTSFVPSEKFVLKMQYEASKTDEVFHEPTDYYKVEVTEYGKKYPLPCISQSGAADVSVATGGLLICETVVQQLQFNPANLRFARYYEAGFTNGKDNNDDTPAISAGTCTKIP
jgi:hypothetical protein